MEAPCWLSWKKRTRKERLNFWRVFARINIKNRCRKRWGRPDSLAMVKSEWRNTIKNNSLNNLDTDCMVVQVKTSCSIRKVIEGNELDLVHLPTLFKLKSWVSRNTKMKTIPNLPPSMAPCSFCGPRRNNEDSRFPSKRKNCGISSSWKEVLGIS